MAPVIGTVRWWLVAWAFVLGLASCVHTDLVRIEDPVGPEPGPIDAKALDRGTLVVHTESFERHRGDSVIAYVHAGYTVYDLHGTQMRKTPGWTSLRDEDAEPVSLPPGTYRVRTRGLHGQQVELTVRLEAGRTTTVWLHGRFVPPADAIEGSIARAPDGRPIGWHARGPSRLGYVGELRYEGSSTVAAFVRDATSVYRGAEIFIDSRGESKVGEVAVLGTADIGGVARPVGDVPPQVECERVGQDAIVVIVNADVAVDDISRETLAALFAGEVDNWTALGGPDRKITPLITAKGSATRTTFRDAVLEGRPYRAVVVRPDAEIIERVARSTAVIGQISLALVREDDRVRVLAIDGHTPTDGSGAYPIVRPLYLCIERDGDPAARAFVRWALSPAGQDVVRRRFIGVSPARVP